MIEATAYTADQQAIWDSFIEEHGIFTHKRNFMDYHCDRFEDASVFLWKKSELVGVFPANVRQQSWESHGGLSFGGLVTKTLKTADYLDCWQALLKFGLERGFKTLLYKALPPYYLGHWHQPNSLVMSYLQAKVLRVENNSLIAGYRPNSWHLQRHRGIKKAQKAKLSIDSHKHWDEYWELLSSNLKKRHNVIPAHSLAEMLLLKSRFPEHIHLYTVHSPEAALLGGTVLWKYQHLIHAQYISSSPVGRKLGALDALFSSLIKKYQTLPLFSLGVSAMRSTHQINSGLQAWKDSWGAQTFPHYVYEIYLANLEGLENRLIYTQKLG